MYLAEQLSTAQPRALKIMHARLVDDAKQRARFVREAQIAARVESEHVVEVVAAGVTEGAGVPWLAMELLRGCDLSRLTQVTGPLDLPHVVAIVEQLCHGLGAAHDADIVHRDLKPQNVFLSQVRSRSRPWAVKILDFGIAKVVSASHQTTAALGSPAWMAPEQTDTSSDLGPPADVWALGLVVFWMLTGRFYWRSLAGEHDVGVQAVLREVLFEPLEAPSTRAASLDATLRFPASLDDWFLRCLIRAPDERFRDANAAWQALRDHLDGSVPSSRALPAEVGELAARAATPLDLTPATRDDEGGDDDAGGGRDLDATVAEGAAAASSGRAHEGTDDDGDDARVSSSPNAHGGPTLESLELSVPSSDAAAVDFERKRAARARRWLAVAAFAGGGVAAVALFGANGRAGRTEPEGSPPSAGPPPPSVTAPAASVTTPRPSASSSPRVPVASSSPRVAPPARVAAPSPSSPPATTPTTTTPPSPTPSPRVGETHPRPMGSGSPGGQPKAPDFLRVRAQRQLDALAEQAKRICRFRLGSARQAYGFAVTYNGWGTVNVSAPVPADGRGVCIRRILQGARGGPFRDGESAVLSVTVVFDDDASGL